MYIYSSSAYCHRWACQKQCLSSLTFILVRTHIFMSRMKLNDTKTAFNYLPLMKKVEEKRAVGTRMCP